jgi:hypothetical protein
MSTISHERIRNQRFADDSFANATQVVSWFGAIQGQEYAPTKWSIGLRDPQLTDVDVETQLDAGKILRTHLLRPTWHLVVAKDIRWLLKLTAPGIRQLSAYYFRQYELGTKEFSKAFKIITKSLQGGFSQTREEINEALSAGGLKASGPRLGHIMMNAELEGLVCSGPRAGKQFTYALLEERVRPAKTLERDESLAELAKTYFTSRGPATIHDFATWSGLRIADCKAAIELAGRVLSSEKVSGVIYYRGSRSRAGLKRPGMMLLPIYDELIMGYKDRSALGVFRNSLKPVPKLKHNNMIVWDGQIIGTWKRVVGPKRLKAEFQFFRPLDETQKAAFESARSRLEGFAQLQLEEDSFLNSNRFIAI